MQFAFMEGVPFGIIIPIVALMIPIVAMLTRHQQKMAEILNQGRGDHSEIEALRREVAELKSLVQNQTIAIDNYRSFQTSVPPPAPNIESRLS